MEEEEVVEGKEEDVKQSSKERSEWFKGKREKENEKMKLQTQIKYLKAFCATLQCKFHILEPGMHHQPRTWNASLRDKLL